MRLLRPGDEGPEVLTLRALLAKHGWTTSAPQNPVFDASLAAVVRSFQAASDLKVDAIVGPRTWSALSVLMKIPPGGGREWLLSELLTRREADPDLVNVKAVIEAIMDVGKVEEPWGSNSGPALASVLLDGAGVRYTEYIGQPTMDPPPWCAIAASNWIRRALGVQRWEDTPMGAWFGAVAQWEDWATDENRRQTPTASAPPGAVFTMARDGSGSDATTRLRSGHCGLVAYRDGDSLVTVEGNVENGVQWRRRDPRTLRMVIPWWG